jgi:hypothetical protein
MQNVLDLWRDFASGTQDTPEAWGIKELRLGPPMFLAPGVRSYRPSPTQPLDELAIDPGLFMERLLPGALACVDALLSSVDHTQVAGPVASRWPPQVDEEDATPEARRRVILLGGVS